MFATSFLPTRLLTISKTIDTDAKARQALHMACSILLDYPTAERYESFDLIRDELEATALPAEIHEELRAFFSSPELSSHQRLEEHYVGVFDMKRRATMYLSYYLTGDTRKRGTALVRFIEAYRAGGCEIEREELPDYLPMVLEFSALGDAQIAGDLLSSHREGIELLRTTLEQVESPYAHLARALCMTLPPISDETKERYLRLITDGPPAELVGAHALGPLEPNLSLTPKR